MGGGRWWVLTEDRGGTGYKFQGEQRAPSILVPFPPHPLPGPACRRLLPPRAAHGSTYYSLRCVRRVGRQIRGTLRLPESQGGDFKAGREASLFNAGDLGLIPGWGRSPGEGHGNPHQYSCQENPMDRGAWWAIVHGVTKSWT